MKNEILQNFNHSVDQILDEAKKRDYPHYKLIEYRKELDNFIAQENCHHEIITEVRNNVRYWKCKHCKKIFSYETIK